MTSAWPETVQVLPDGSDPLGPPPSRLSKAVTSRNGGRQKPYIVNLSAWKS